MKNEIESSLKESISIKTELLSNSVDSIIKIANILVEAFRTGHSLYLMGNGGSAADAQHISGELVGRFKKNRKSLIQFQNLLNSRGPGIGIKNYL